MELDLGPRDSLELMRRKSPRFLIYQEGNELTRTDMYERNMRAFHSPWRHFRAGTAVIHACIGVYDTEMLVEF